MSTLRNGRIKDGPTPVKAPHTRRRQPLSARCRRGQRRLRPLPARRAAIAYTTVRSYPSVYERACTDTTQAVPRPRKLTCVCFFFFLYVVFFLFCFSSVLRGVAVPERPYSPAVFFSLTSLPSGGYTGRTGTDKNDRRTAPRSSRACGTYALTCTHGRVIGNCPNGFSVLSYVYPRAGRVTTSPGRQCGSGERETWDGQPRRAHRL